MKAIFTFILKLIVVLGSLILAHIIGEACLTALLAYFTLWQISVMLTLGILGGSVLFTVVESR
jgi:hypothetical protein